MSKHRPLKRDAQVLPPTTRPPFEQIVLMLQGGGALGAYQAGVYQALAERNIHPDWVAGISIGAINGAIIAGNEPEARVDKLRAFWEGITQDHVWSTTAKAFGVWGQAARGIANQMSANAAMLAGVPGFFSPRWPMPWLDPTGPWAPYDTKPMKLTLERLTDFDRINAGATRYSAGAVNIRTGLFVHFDSEARQIRAEHVMASAALPPGLPAVEIDGDHYWDGGIVSNSPAQWIAAQSPRRDTLAFQVDLWSGMGRNPKNMLDATMRQKEVQYGSRTRDNAHRFIEEQKVRAALADLLPKLPEDLRGSPEAQALAPFADHKVFSMVNLAYQASGHEGNAKDYEFSRLSMEEHWKSGYDAADRMLSAPGVLARPTNAEGITARGLELAEDPDLARFLEEAAP